MYSAILFEVFHEEGNNIVMNKSRPIYVILKLEL